MHNNHIRVDSWQHIANEEVNKPLPVNLLLYFKSFNKSADSTRPFQHPLSPPVTPTAMKQKVNYDN